MTKRASAILALILVLMLGHVNMMAANTKTTVSQVSSMVTLSDDVDYIITGATPFTADGLVNITNTDHAVLILDNIKPSKITTWLKYIQINGAKAVNGTNCQVKLYNLGCIVLPYSGGDKFKPLTVYSEPNFEGDMCNDFGLEHTDGYMNTLTDAKLNNRISSFKLKRGYMVTFSLKADGRGYSRCFIAADEDLEMAQLPAIMNNSITSYRVFKWYDAGKKQLANDLNTTTLAALNVQSSYTWSEGHDMGPDYECVPNHIYEDYPSSRAIGRATWSPHTKNNNEPKNGSDDHPQDLNTILNNWENMMRTGMRLCSPASWDGSDYWNATGFLADFLDSVDARGWRCDIIDLHCYWAEGSFGNMHYWSDKYKRPIWISEWCWGASWNSNGAFASGATETQTKEALERICTKMNGWDYVERYYYWNGERDPSRLYKNGSLTPAGKYYSEMNSGIAYNGKMNYVPKIPTQYDPSDLIVEFNNAEKVATLQWYDRNGEMNNSMVVQRRPGTGKSWETIASIDLKDDAGTYTYEDREATNGCQYQIVIKDANNRERKTSIVTAASATLKAGDALDLDGKTYYLGGNILTNGSFEMGFTGWTDGKGNTLSAPYFQVVGAGGNDGQSYLQAYGNGGISSESAVNTQFNLKANTNYYFSIASCNMPGGISCRVGPGREGSTSISPKLYIDNKTTNWVTQFVSFENGESSIGRIQMYNLAAKAQVDQALLCQLYTIKDSAIADGIEKARLKAEMFKAYNTKFDYLNNDLTSVLSAITGNDAEALAAAEKAVEEALTAYNYLADGTLLAYAEKVAAWKLYGYEQFEALLTAAKNAKTVSDVAASYTALELAIDDYMTYNRRTDNIKNPTLAKSVGWTTKAGTYKDGDQRLNTIDGVTCWNAWWNNVEINDTTLSLAIKQDMGSIGTGYHGLYALECKASTEHYCLSDQHGYITDGTTTEKTQTLKADFLDLNMPVANRWDRLYSAPIYLEDNAKLTIGFESSKQGAMDGAWLEVGNALSTNKNDKREGWWCATDFAIRYTPLYIRTVVPNQFATICLPYAMRSSSTVKFYKIVGVNPEYTQLCLEEMDEVEAGVPCIFRSTEAEAYFLEYGEKPLTSGKAGDGNLRGYLNVPGSVQTDYYYDVNGAFEKVVGDRPERQPYSGNMRAFDDKNSKAIPTIEDWQGETMPIHGVTDNEKTANNEKVQTGIQFVSKTLRQDGLFTLDGRYVGNSNVKPGLYIRVVDGRTYKTLVK